MRNLSLSLCVCLYIYVCVCVCVTCLAAGLQDNETQYFLMTAIDLATSSIHTVIKRYGLRVIPTIREYQRVSRGVTYTAPYAYIYIYVCVYMCI